MNEPREDIDKEGGKTLVRRIKCFSSANTMKIYDENSEIKDTEKRKP